MPKNYIFVNYTVLRNFMKNVFIKYGVPSKDAQICADVLIDADLKGIDSHGIARLKNIYCDRIKEKIQYAKTKIKFLKNKGATALIDGGHGMGMVIAKKAMNTAIAKAKKYGIGMTAVCNSTHYGIAGYYAEMAAKKNMIGITGTNARPSAAPTFGVENMMGTNPLTFGIPTDEKFPFVIDCATSLSQRGKIETYARLNKKLPAGWVIGKNGKSKTDAAEVLNDLMTGAAALAPLGGIGEEGAGYKGYGYAATVEILSAALTNGKFLKDLLGVKNGKKTKLGLGHFFIAVNVSFFISPFKFKKTAGAILKKLRESKKAPQHKKIYTAGEKEYLSALQRKKTGIPITPATKKELIELINETGLLNYKKIIFGKS